MSTSIRYRPGGTDDPRTPFIEEFEELANELSREFSAPVALFDIETRRWLYRLGIGPEALPETSILSLCLEPGQVSIHRVSCPTPAIWLAFPVSQGGGLERLALVGFHGGTPNVDRSIPWGGPCPEPALRAWGQAVANRLRNLAESRVAAEDLNSSLLMPSVADRLIRKLRVSDTPNRFQSLAVRAVLDALDVEAVAWVPGSPAEPVVLAGGVAGIELDDYRSFLSHTGTGAVWISNRPSSNLPKQVVRLVAVADHPVGWLMALNPRDHRLFGAEVELLQTVATLLATQRANARLYGDLKELLFGVIRALTAAIDAKDPYTSGHSERVARIAVRLGEELGLSANERGDLYLMGLLHDVGKIGIEDGVLKKPGKLSPEEYRAIQSHVKIGVHILADLKKLHHLLPGVAHHHEHMDGSGYPSGLTGDQIPLPARILAVADAFDAMSSSRPYRRRMTWSQIEEVFRHGAGQQWDPIVIDALFACQPAVDRIRQKGLGESLRQAVGEALGRS